MRLGIIGFGKLGKSVANLLVQNGYRNNLIISDTRLKYPHYSMSETIDESDFLFLCVNPNDIETVISEINKSESRNLCFYPEKTIVSCVSSLTVDFLENRLYTQQPIIHCIPKLPINIRKNIESRENNKELGSITFLTNKKVADDLIAEFYFICDGPSINYVKTVSLYD